MRYDHLVSSINYLFTFRTALVNQNEDITGMNFLNSAFDSSNFIKSNSANQANQCNSSSNSNSTSKPNGLSNVTNENTNVRSSYLLQINPALNRTYCSKTLLYCESISRALDISSCKVVPFFGSFLHDFRQILDGVPSQITMCNKNIQKPVEV